MLRRYQNKLIFLFAVISLSQAQAKLSVAAYQAFPAWSKKTTNERADLVDRVAELLLAKSDLFAEIITSEVGMPLKLSKLIQVGNAISSWKHYAQIARDFKYEGRDTS